VIKEDVSDAIVEACVNFSASKTGALIVFQQNTELYNYAQTGVMMKAKVTDELIENIFFKKSYLIRNKSRIFFIVKYYRI